MAEFDLKSLSKQDLAVMHFTGRDVVTGYGRDKSHRYRPGVMTKMGDLEENEWIAYVESLIERDHEEEKLQTYIEYARTCAWLHTEKEIRKYALELYAGDFKIPLQQVNNEGGCNV